MWVALQFTLVTTAHTTLLDVMASRLRRGRRPLVLLGVICTACYCVGLFICTQVRAARLWTRTGEGSGEGEAHSSEMGGILHTRQIMTGFATTDVGRFDKQAYACTVFVGRNVRVAADGPLRTVVWAAHRRHHGDYRARLGLR